MSHLKNHLSLSPDKDDGKLITSLKSIVRLMVSALSIVMTFVVIWGVVDVCYVIYERIIQPPLFILKISDILTTFSAILVVLIAIEIFINVILFLKKDVIEINIVLATALMAVARKIIVLDLTKVSALQIFALAAVIFSLGVTYYLVVVRQRPLKLKIPSKSK